MMFMSLFKRIILYTGVVLVNAGFSVTAYEYETDSVSQTDTLKQNQVEKQSVQDTGSISTHESEEVSDTSVRPDANTVRMINEKMEQISHYLKERDYRRAILLIKDCEALDPYNPDITALLVRTLNNYAVSLSNAGDFSKAIRTIEQAYIVDPTDQVKDNYVRILRNAIIRYIEEQQWDDALRTGTYLRELTDDAPESWELYLSIFLVRARNMIAAGRVNDAQESYMQVLDYVPNHKDALYSLGRIAYDRQRLRDAKKYWDTLALYEKDPQLEALRGKLERELAVEDKFSAKEISHFDIRYDETIDRRLLKDFREVLEDAYNDIGSRFSMYPKENIIVLFMEHDAFLSSTRLPHFVRGIYDGKIRVPVLGRQSDDELREIIYHEYVHAIIHRVGGGRVPRWFNEGLAERFSRDELEYEWLKAHILENTCIPVDDLDGALIYSNDLSTINLAYEQSTMIVEYILYQYSMWHVRQMIDKFKNGETFDTILKDTLHTDLESFEEDWKKYARKRVLSRMERKKLRKILDD